jgi:hypothetical protein
MRKQTSLAIASESPQTVNAGVQLAELGGNAVDIAVGSALAATVAEALMCSLGGSAFINIKTPGCSPVLIDGADGMPVIPQQRRRTREQIWREVHLPYGDGISVNVGHASIAVPGMLRALELAWKLYGSLPWREIATPAVELARSGTTANETLVKWLAIAGKAIFFPQRESRESFFPDGSNPLQKGDFHKTPHLDASLELIAKEGADALYRGDIGRAMAREISENHGYVTFEDLGRYQAVTLRRDKGLADTPALFRADRDILQVGIGGRQAACRGHRLVVGGMHPAGPAVDHLRQFVRVGRLQLAEAAVFQQQFRQGVIQGEFGQHFLGRRRGTLGGFLDDRQLQLLEQDFPQLLG